MDKKIKKGKVGRPKLADLKTKKESIFVSIYVLAITFIFSIIGYNVLTIDFNPKYMVGTVYNEHINSCIINNKSIDCGPNVIYMEYSVDGKEKNVVQKENESIKVKIDDYKKIKICYNTKNTKLECKKKAY